MDTNGTDDIERARNRAIRLLQVAEILSEMGNDFAQFNDDKTTSYLKSVAADITTFTATLISSDEPRL